MSDTGHALDHPEAAGWVLGALDPDDSARFEGHLATCQQCQAQVAEFSRVAESLALAAPAAEPPDDLALRVVAAVKYAALAENASTAAPAAPAPASAVKAKPKARPAARAHRWWHFHWDNPLYAALGAAAITAAAFTGSLFIHGSPALAASISLRSEPGYTGSGLATAQKTPAGFEISLTVTNLPAPGPGQFYECWYAGPGNRPGHPELITAGTFITGSTGSTGSQTLHMWSAADPATFKIMQITLEQPGDASQHGKVILSGIAQV